MQQGEERTDGDGIQATGHDRFQEEGPALASNRAARETGRKLRKPVQGLGGEQEWSNPIPTGASS